MERRVTGRPLAAMSRHQGTLPSPAKVSRDGWSRGDGTPPQARGQRGSSAGPPAPELTRKCSPQPQRLPNGKLDFIAQDLADLWTDGGQGARLAHPLPSRSPLASRGPTWALLLSQKVTQAWKVTLRPYPQPLPLLDTRVYRELKIHWVRIKAQGSARHRLEAWLCHLWARPWASPGPL